MNIYFPIVIREFPRIATHLNLLDIAAQLLRQLRISIGFFRCQSLALEAKPRWRDFKQPRIKNLRTGNIIPDAWIGTMTSASNVYLVRFDRDFENC